MHALTDIGKAIFRREEGLQQMPNPPLNSPTPFYGDNSAKMYFFAAFCFALVIAAYFYGGFQYYPYVFLLTLAGLASIVVGYVWGHPTILRSKRARQFITKLNACRSMP